jgi:hypothetical protein
VVYYCVVLAAGHAGLDVQLSRSRCEDAADITEVGGCNSFWGLLCARALTGYPPSPHMFPTRPRPTPRDKLHEDHHHHVTS